MSHWEGERAALGDTLHGRGLHRPKINFVVAEFKKNTG